MAGKPLRPAVLLVADRTLSANYKVLFEGIFGTMQTTHVPELAMRLLVSPKMPVESDGRAQAAPLGIRRVESALLAAGFTPDQVACATPESVGKLLGPWTKIVGVSSADPLGGGMSNTTTTAFWTGRLYTAHWMDRLTDRLRQAKKKFGFVMVGGGAGAWQWERNSQRAAQQGFDVIFQGCFEAGGPEMFQQLLSGRTPAAGDASLAGLELTTKDNLLVARQRRSAVELIAPIRGPSMLGVIETSRGCGNGCRFCAAGLQRMEHLPVEAIMADLRVNAAGGRSSVVSSSEDFFRYGGSGGRVNFPALCGLLEAMRQVEPLDFMQIDHANISSLLQLSTRELTEVRRLLNWRKHSDYLWVNMGIESANGQLVAANAPGKFGPFRAEDWEDMVLQAAARMTESGFFSVFSLVLGLPGETADDVRRTRRLVDRLSRERAVIFPVFYEPILPGERAFGLAEMTLEHLELYQACYEINFRWVPRLYWDNQRAGGVSLGKRLLVQSLGGQEVRAWRSHFRRLRRRLTQPAGRA